MNRTLGFGLGIFAAVVVIVAYASIFTVNLTQQAIVLQFGDPKALVTEPGLHFKLPFVQNVVFIDKRILNLDAPTEEIIASDRKRLVVDAFARYKIVNALKFYQAIGSISQTNDRLKPNFASALRNVLGDHTLEEVVRDNRAGLMQQIENSFNKTAKDFGIQVVDVRIRRADLPEANSQAIYRRMQTEREREAAEIRAQGQEEAQRIRSRADRDRTVIIADAQRDAEITRGQGDAKRNEIFAKAFQQDPEFFDFYRSMQAYRKALEGSNTTMVISPDSEFFRYFGSDTGKVPKR